MVVLEFEKIPSTIANRAATPMGREHVLRLTPRIDPLASRRELATVSDTRRLLGSRPEFSCPPCAMLR
jgi:dsDNA-specific endonuclease/ATPase MutS2